MDSWMNGWVGIKTHVWAIIGKVSITTYQSRFKFILCFDQSISCVRNHGFRFIDHFSLKDDTTLQSYRNKICGSFIQWKFNLWFTDSIINKIGIILIVHITVNMISVLQATLLKTSLTQVSIYILVWYEFSMPKYRNLIKSFEWDKKKTKQTNTCISHVVLNVKHLTQTWTLTWVT